MSQSSSPDGQFDGNPAKSEISPQEPAGDQRVSSQAMLFTLLAIVLVVVLAAILLQVFVAEDIPPLTEARLIEAEEQWQESGPASYNMELEIRGAQPGAVRIEVRDGSPIAMTRDGIAPPERTWDVWSVRGMFDTLAQELVLAEDPQHEMDVEAGTKLQLLCDFDPQYGYPKHYLRYATEGAPEVFWRVKTFETK